MANNGQTSFIKLKSGRIVQRKIGNDNTKKNKEKKKSVSYTTLLEQEELASYECE